MYVYHVTNGCGSKSCDTDMIFIDPHVGVGYINEMVNLHKTTQK